MKVLMVTKGIELFSYKVPTFVHEQAIALQKIGVEVEYFRITGKGIKGYLKSIFALNKKVRKNKYDIIHSNYGFSGTVGVMQNKVPVVATLIGSDVNNNTQLFINKLLLFKRAKYLIFVSKRLHEKAGKPSNSMVLPYGIDFNKFFPVQKHEAISKIKIYTLAKEAINLLEPKNDKLINLVEFKGISPEYLNYYYNACDLFLMTSTSEGSPQAIKEAMACNCPIVSTDVGDVKEIIDCVEGCFITSFDSNDVAKKIELALNYGKRTRGRGNISSLHTGIVVKNLTTIYNSILK
jgi:teichuronic acid biosynthesis glycosyltransferase TuaC